MLSKSNVTSLSFTVEDDLISQSSLNSTRKTAFHGLKPFSKKYGLNQQNFDEIPLPKKANRQIIQRAKIDAYKQMNEHLFNPFEHKLGGGFVVNQSDLYQQQKMRQIQFLKKKQEQAMKSTNSYTIVFNNQKKSKQNLQMAGKNIVDGGDVPGISDYYKMKFSKKSMDKIQQQNDEIQHEKNQQAKKINNFIASNKKKQKNMIEPVTHSTSQKSKKQIESSDSNRSRKEPENQSKNVMKQKAKSNKQIQNSQQKVNKSIQNKRNNEVQKRYDPLFKNQNNKNQDRPPFVLNPSIQNQNIKKQNKKPPVPKVNNQGPLAPKINNQRASKNTVVKKNIGNQKKKFSQVYEGSDRNLVQQLQRELVQCPTLSFDDIAELQVAKNLLQEAVLLPKLIPNFFQGIRKAMKGILLFGPPGTGKTLLAKAIAKDNVFFNVSASSLASKWKGQSQKMVRILFEMAKYHSPSVIFFDQIDCIGSKRSQNQHQSARKVKTQLLVQMDGVGSTQNQVFVLAATNRPWDLDQALRRRLQKRIYIPLPGAQGRRKMFDINLKGLKITDKVDWEKLVDLTKGCSGADICNICRDAAYMPMRRKIAQVGGIAKLQQLKQCDLTQQQVLEKDLIQSAKKVKPSVGKEDLKKYQSWMNQFGSS